MNELQVRMDDYELRLKENVEESRKLEFVISTSARDSHRTVLNQDNWDLSRYKKNGVVAFQHNTTGAGMCSAENPDYVLGPGRAWTEDDASRKGKRMLIGEWTAEPREINELAEKVFRKVLFGTLRATSVGFSALKNSETGVFGEYGKGREAENGADPTFYFYGQHLYEWSIVSIPSNPETVKRAFYNDTRAAIDFIKKVVPELSTKDIMRMTVADILKEMDEKPHRAAFSSTTRDESQQKVTEFIRDVFIEDAVKSVFR
jgi:hypothetical protein